MSMPDRPREAAHLCSLLLDKLRLTSRAIELEVELEVLRVMEGLGEGDAAPAGVGPYRLLADSRRVAFDELLTLLAARIHLENRIERGWRALSCLKRP